MLVMMSSHLVMWANTQYLSVTLTICATSPPVYIRHLLQVSALFLLMMIFDRTQPPQCTIERIH